MVLCAMAPECVGKAIIRNHEIRELTLALRTTIHLLMSVSPSN